MKTQNLLGNGNTKLQKTAKEFGVRIFNFSIPAGNDKKSGKITCPFAGSCLKLCYAKRGMYRFGNVERALTKRYEASKEENFVQTITEELAKVKKDKQIYIRIHDSGDFYSPAYFAKWLEITFVSLIMCYIYRYGNRNAWKEGSHQWDAWVLRGRC
jgi:hypothetical protein